MVHVSCSLSFSCLRSSPLTGLLDRAGKKARSASGAKRYHVMGGFFVPEAVRLWAIGKEDALVQIEPTELDLEARIENWIKRDVSVLRPDLLVIGNQVETAYGGFIDVLCIDRHGNLVVVELKRAKTPRDTTAQALDYASWVRDLSTGQITSIADTYLGPSGPLDTAFKNRFDADLPDIINESHSLLIVASHIDASSERIINYLSDQYGVDINAVTFQYFRNGDGQEYLARTYLVAPREVEDRARTKGHSRRTVPTWDQIQALADDHGVGGLYELLTSDMSQFTSVARRKSSVTVAGEMTDGSTKALLALLPDQSSAEDGLRYQLYTDRLAEYCGLPQVEILALLPEGHEPYAYYPDAPPDLTGRAGFFRTKEEASRFLQGITVTGAMKQHMQRKSELSPGQKSSLTKKAKTVAG